MFLVDSHCHLNKLNYKVLHQDITDVITKAHLKGVKLMLAVCTTLPEFYVMKSTISHLNNMLFSCGVHPLNIDKTYNFSKLRNLSTEKKVVALGETGLDYYYHQNNKIQQQEVFREHIYLGRILNKPVIIHMRNATKDTLDILREERASDCGGVLHCFSEDQETAKKLIDMGFYISFSGIITFRNTEKLRNVARYVPLDYLLLETDSPYLSPVPYRGKENQPAYLRNIAEFVAMLRGISLEQLAEYTTNNFSNLFQIKIKQ